MTNRLEALEDWAAALLRQLEPAARSKLARSIGQALRRNQQQRIIAQRNPDKSLYTPRKRRGIRGKQGRLKRKVQMFQKLRTTKYLKIRGDGNAISVGFNGRVSRVARVHQYGLKDYPTKNTPAVTYHQREILGLTEADVCLIRDGLLNHLDI